MNLRRTSLLLFVPVLWLLGAGYYWRTSVLLLPERVFDLPKGTAFRGFAPNGDAVLVHTVRPGARTDGHTDVGPIERWRFPELKKVREVFAADDAIDMARADELGRIVIVREGKAWLANFETGEVLEELPGVEMKPCYRVLHKDRLIWQRDQTIVVYDLANRRVLANYPGHTAIGQVTDAFSVLIATETNRGNTLRFRTTVINTETGRPDDRFGDPERVEYVQFSPDRRLAVVYELDTMVVCDASSGKRLWSIRRPSINYDDIRFEEGSSILAMDVLDGHRRSRTARWRVADGVVIDPVPAQTSGRVNHDFDEQGAYAIDNHFFEKSWLVQGVERAVYELKRWSGVKNVGWPSPHQSVWEVRELRTSRTIGRYSDVHCGAIIAPDGSGFIAATDEDMNNHRLRYYRLPPRRDWGWLLRWGVLPAVGLGVLGCGVGWMKRRRGLVETAVLV